MMGENRPKHVELTWNNKLIYIMHLVCYFHRQMLVMNVSLSVKCCSKLGKIHNEQIQTGVFVVCLN
jgi:hypothetical protein